MSAVVAGSAFRPVAGRALIGGEWCAAGRLVEVRDPYRGEVVGTVPVSSPADVQAIRGFVEKVIPELRQAYDE